VPGDAPNVPGDVQALATAVDTHLADTGWVAITLNTGITTNTVNPAYRVIAGVVYFRGDFKGTGTFPAGGGPYTIVAIGGIPTSARPAQNMEIPTVSTGGFSGLLLFVTDGSVTFLNGPTAAGNMSFANGSGYPVG
jgi:hypothetical protein